MTATPQELVDAGAEILSAYLDDGRTSRLKTIAEIIVQLREAHARKKDGITDWHGRSTAYRQLIAEMYRRAGVPDERRNTVESAVRYHVHNLLPERAPAHELQAIGGATTTPKTRLATRRKAIQAQAQDAAPRHHVATLAAYAQALLARADEKAIPGLTPQQAEEAHEALTAVQRRAAELLACVEARTDQ